MWYLLILYPIYMVCVHIIHPIRIVQYQDDNWYFETMSYVVPFMWHRHLEAYSDRGNFRPDYFNSPYSSSSLEGIQKRLEAFYQEKSQQKKSNKRKKVAPKDSIYEEVGRLVAKGKHKEADELLKRM